MQAGQAGLLGLLPSCLRRPSSTEPRFVHAIHERNSPAEAEDRRTGQRRGIPGGVAANHRPEVRQGRLERRRRSDQPAQPVHGLRILLEPRDLSAANAHDERRMPLLAGQERSPGFVLLSDVQPGGRQGETRRRLETIGGVGNFHELSERQRGGQRRGVIQVIQPQQEGRFVAGLGVKIPPRRLSSTWSRRRWPAHRPTYSWHLDRRICRRAGDPCGGIWPISSITRLLRPRQLEPSSSGMR